MSYRRLLKVAGIVAMAVMIAIIPFLVTACPSDDGDDNGTGNGGEVVKPVQWIPTESPLYAALLDRVNLKVDGKPLKAYQGTDGTNGRHFDKQWITEELEEIAARKPHVTGNDAENNADANGKTTTTA